MDSFTINLNIERIAEFETRRSSALEAHVKRPARSYRCREIDGQLMAMRAGFLALQRQQQVRAQQQPLWEKATSTHGQLTCRRADAQGHHDVTKRHMLPYV